MNEQDKSDLSKPYLVFKHEGRFIVGKEGDLIVNGPSFATNQFAQAHAKFCNRTDQILLECQHQLKGRGVLTISNYDGIFPSGSGYGPLCPRYTSDGVTLAEWEGGRLVQLNVPYLLWVWLRTSVLARGLRALWRGWA